MDPGKEPLIISYYGIDGLHWYNKGWNANKQGVGIWIQVRNPSLSLIMASMVCIGTIKDGTPINRGSEYGSR